MHFLIIAIVFKGGFIMAKTVFISGASRGIGKSIVNCFARKGYNLVLVCKSSIEQLQEIGKIISDQYKVEARCYTCDVADSNAVNDLFRRLSKEGIQIDVLINNAGISYIGLLQDMTDEEWNQVINTNLSSCFFTSRAVLPQMISRHNGRIINISSVWGKVGASTEVAYSASKGGVNAFTKALAKEVAPSGISVNAIACGFIDTQMNKALTSNEKKSIFEEIPAGRPGTSDEVAEMVYKIVTASDYLTGQVISFDGAWT